MFFHKLVQISIIFAHTLINNPLQISANSIKSQFAYRQTEFHNAKRALHGVGQLTWSNQLANYALQYGQKCLPGHSQNNQNGENLAFGSPPEQFTEEELFNLWYAELQYYDFTNPGFSEKTGHFSQIVWKGSTQLGCVVVQCPASNGWSNTYKELICEYSPAGNVIGQFQENVFPPKND